MTTTLRAEVERAVVELLLRVTVMHPTVARRVAQLRLDSMPDVKLLAVMPDGAALLGYADDTGQPQQLLVPVPPPSPSRLH